MTTTHQSNLVAEEEYARKRLGQIGMPEDVMKEIELCPHAGYSAVLDQLAEFMKVKVTERAAMYWMLRPVDGRSGWRRVDEILQKGLY